MGLLIFLQVILDLAFIALGTLLLIERAKQRTMEDPRMSRGLQLLSSKIAIIQDLMDRSDQTARHLTNLIDAKQQSVQERIEDIESHLAKVAVATEKSREVVGILQSKVPHQEFVERQTTAKYAQAAKMAHGGSTPTEISQRVNISRGEVELIAKLNRDRIVTREPAWLESAEKTLGVQPQAGALAVAGVRAAGDAPKSVEVATSSSSGASVSPGTVSPMSSSIQADHVSPEKPPAGAQVTEYVSFPLDSRKNDGVVRPVLFKKISMPLVDELDLG